MAADNVGHESGGMIQLGESKLLGVLPVNTNPSQINNLAEDSQDKKLRAMQTWL